MSHKSVKSLEIELPEKVSTNVFYRKHFADRHRIQGEFLDEVWVAVKQAKVDPIERYPVELEFVFHLSGKSLDNTNTSAMAKMVEDGLRHCRVLKDDSPRYVSRVTLSQRRSKDRQFVEVLFG